MALLFVESFEGYGSTPGGQFGSHFYSGKWFTDNAPNTVVGGGRDGGCSLRLNHDGLGAGFNIPLQDSVFTLGFALRVSALPGFLDVPILRFRFNTNIRTAIWLNPAGFLQLRRNTTVLATGTTSLSANTWYYIELQTACRATGGFYHLRINEVTELTGTGSLVESGGNGANNIFWSSRNGSGTLVEVDDIYLLNDSGSSNVDFLGECKVEHLLPTANYAVAWTPDSGNNFARVNEAEPDGNTSYVETSTTDAEDLYEFADLAVAGVIHGVVANAHAITSSSSLMLAARSGSTTVAGSTHSLTGSYAWYGQIWDVNPVTTSQWTPAEIDAAQFGVKQVAGTPRLTRLGINVLRSYAAAADPLEVTATSTVDLSHVAFLDRTMFTRVGSFAAPVATGNQTITGIPFRPKALLLFPSIGTSEGEPLADLAYIHIGAAGTDNSQCALSLRGGYAFGLGPDGGCLHRNNACVALADNNGSNTGWLADFVTFTDDGFTIHWTASAGTNFVVHYLALGGIVMGDSVVAELQSPASAGSQSYSLGFSPDGLVFMAVPVSDSNSGNSGNPLSLSIGMADSDVNQGVTAIGMLDQISGSTPSAAYRLQRKDRVISTIAGGSPGAVFSDAELTAIEPDGFTLEWHTVTAQHRFFVLGLRGGGYRVGAETQRSSVGTKSTQTPRVQPRAVLMQTACSEATDSIAQDWLHSIGAMNNSGQFHMDSVYRNSESSGIGFGHNWYDEHALQTFVRNSNNTIRSIRGRAAYQSFEQNGFTLNWEQAEATAREFLYMVFGDEFLAPVSATSALALDQDIEDFHVPNYQASSPINLTQSARGPFPLYPESNLAIDHALNVSGDYSGIGHSPLDLTQSLVRRIALAKQVTHSLDLASVADLVRETLSDMDLSNAAIGLLAKRVSSTLSLTDEAMVPYSAESFLELSQEAFIPWRAVSTLIMHDEAIVTFPAATQLLRSTLSLTQSVSVQSTLHLFGVSTLNLHQAVALVPPTLGCTWDQIDDPAHGRTKGIILVGDTEVEINRSMNLGDIDRMAFDRIVRETRGGTLHVFADPIWPKTETLVFSISALTRMKAHEVIDFLLAHLGREISLITHEGRQWTGFILNPNDVVTEDRSNSFTVNIEFEGQIVESS